MDQAHSHEETEHLLHEHHAHEKSVESVPAPDPTTQREVESISESPFFPLKFKEFSYILFTLLRAGIPSSLAMVAASLRNLVTLSSIGRYATSTELAGASLATSLSQLLLITIVATMNLGFQIKASHLHGAGKPEQLKILVQRHLCVVTVISVPMLLILAFSDHILPYLGVDPEISRTTAEYFRLTLLAWVGKYMSDLFKCFIMAQNYFIITGIVHVILLVIHVGLTSWFVFGLEMPFVGPAVVRSITEFGIAFLLFVFILWTPELRRAFASWNRQCLRGWWSHFKDMTVLGFDLLVDCALLDFSVLIVLYIGDEHVIGAHSIAMSLCALMFMIPFGNSMAMQSKIGNAVGENMKYKAQKFMAGGLILNFIGCATIIFITLFWNKEIANEMTSIPEVNAILRQFLYVYTIVYLGDSYKDHIAGTLKAIGKEKEVFKIYLFGNITVGIIAQWVLALPLAFEYMGVWLGTAVSMIVTCLLLVHKLVTANWDKEIAGVQKRLKLGDSPEEIEEAEDKNDIL